MSLMLSPEQIRFQQIKQSEAQKKARILRLEAKQNHENRVLREMKEIKSINPGIDEKLCRQVAMRRLGLGL